MKKTITKQDMIDMVSHVENWGRDYQNYRIYFQDRQPNGDREYLDMTEEEFFAIDRALDNELSLKVIN